MNPTLTVLVALSLLVATAGVAAADPICINITAALFLLVEAVSGVTPGSTDVIIEPGVLFDALFTCP